MIVKKQHIGVYGVILEQASILLVKKNRGPYFGKWDLPGGAPQHGEALENALFREVFEETGLHVKEVELFTSLSHEENYEANKRTLSLYHIGIIYMIFDYDKNDWDPGLHAEDVKGSTWIEMEEIGDHSLTPFAMRVVSRIMS